MKAKIEPLGCVEDVDKGFSIILTPENKKEENFFQINDIKLAVHRNAK